MHSYLSALVTILLLAASNVNAHGVITGATGDQGGNGTALGVDASTPRDGTRARPFQQDTTRFSAARGDAADTCGSTKLAGDNDVEAGTQAVMASSGGTLPQVSAGGMVMMTLHQVNSDGAGPYTCMIDTTGQGTNFQPMEVTTNVAGNEKSRNQAGSKTDHPLTAAMPAGANCTGTVAGQTGVCMVRCQNQANAGPFGGCVPVQMVQAAGAAGNATGGAAAVAPAAGASNATAGVATGGNAAADTSATTGNTVTTDNTVEGSTDTAATDEEDEEEEEEDGEQDNSKSRRAVTVSNGNRKRKMAAREALAGRIADILAQQESQEDDEVSREHGE